MTVNNISSYNNAYKPAFGMVKFDKYGRYAKEIKEVLPDLEAIAKEKGDILTINYGSRDLASGKKSSYFVISMEQLSSLKDKLLGYSEAYGSSHSEIINPLDTVRTKKLIKETAQAAFQDFLKRSAVLDFIKTNPQ